MFNGPHRAEKDRAEASVDGGVNKISASILVVVVSKK